MEWFQALLENSTSIIEAASRSGLGIIALSCLVIGAAGIFYLSRADGTSPIVALGIFLFMVLGTLGLSVVALFAGAGRPVDLAGARTITFKTPYFNEQTKTYKLLDATVTNIGSSVWREQQERPDGNAEYYHVVKSIEPGRILFGRRPKQDNSPPDTTELIVDTKQRVLCYRLSADDPNLQCPYALVDIE